ncbi:hypothetical protein GGR53DRAFT_254093 [Hypoxylon sp. FL1150]|nr:hypothetical protein GGR53DRAFT_254093 [Hypoxylon sp. FL1150]
MSTAQNIDSLIGQGEFHSRKPGAEPLTHHGHKPGVKVGNDAVPEFHAEKYPPGTAPREHTFQPHPEGEIPVQEQVTDPSDTLTGATSQTVHTGYGKPMQGMTGRELHGMHPGKRKKERSGLEGVGASLRRPVREKGADLPEGAVKGKNVKGSAEYPSASERVPASAEEVAAEHKE